MDPDNNEYATPPEIWRPLSRAVGGFDLQEFGLKRVEDEHDDRLVAPIDEPNHEIEDEVDRISHGKSNSHIETHVSRTSREQAIEDLREAEELTNDSGSEA